MAKSFKHPTREQWLVAGIKLLDEIVFAPHQQRMPKKWRVTCSWPSRRALSTNNRVVGQCWYPAASKDGTNEIIVSLAVDDPVRVLDIVAHEMVHAVVQEPGHKGKFAKLARAIDLQGKLTATVAGPVLTKQLKQIVKQLGKYPHAKLDATVGVKKQSTRMIKCVCPETGYVVRTTAKWLDEYGAPFGPTGEQMEVS